MAYAEYLTWLQAVSQADTAFKEVDSLLAVKDLFLKSELYNLESTALVPAKGGLVDFVATQSQPVISSGGSAASAFNSYVAAGGGQSAIGSATAGASGTSFAPVATEAVSGGGYGALGILSADVGVVGAAVAPLLGVALGVGLYETNPELWTKISQTILPFAYPDSEEVAVFVDKDGNTWIDGEIITAMRDMFRDESINPDIEYTGTKYSYPGGETISIINTYEGMPFAYSTVGGSTVWKVSASQAGRRMICVEPIPYRLEFSFEGAPGFIIDIGWKAVPLIPVSDRADFNPTGATESPIKVGLPDGTSKWSGNTVDLSNLPTKDIVTDYDTGATKSYYPVSLPPYGADGSIDPTVQPDPTTNTDSNTQVSPYYLPDILPFPSPIPDYNPQPDPETNPSTQPETKPDAEIDDGTPPPSSGDSPPPNVPIVPIPTGGESVNGLIAVYHPTPNELYSFSRWLWVTYADASNINLIWNNPFDGVIGCHELYCTPTDIGRRNIKCGFLDSGINSAIISRYTSINCGNIVVPEYYGNYLDYSPYTSVHIYLPFIGIVQVDADDIIGHAVNITYHIDEYNGSCIAMITVAKKVNINGQDVEYSNLVYQFEGNCSVEVPLSGGSQANIKIAAMTGIMQTVMSTVGGAFGGMMSGNPAMAAGGGVMGLAQGLTSGASALMHAKSSVQHSGQFGASYGAMGVKKPFIIIQRPIQVQVPNYNLEYGFPAHKFVKIGSCTGYLRCREVNVISPRATNEEKARIEEMLKTGVFVQ